MKDIGHKLSTLAAIELLDQYIKRPGQFFWMTNNKSEISQAAAMTDYYEDLEFIDVEGIFGNGGQDNPHQDNSFVIGMAEDNPRVRFEGESYTGFNHFIDIAKGPGYCDDYDGYSYNHGSGSREDFQLASDAMDEEGHIHWIKKMIAGSWSDLSHTHVDEGLMGWLNDEYVHAPGQRWYRERPRACSSAVRKYSRWQEKQGSIQFESIEQESVYRFPTALSIGQSGRGIPYSIFLPIDNLALYWYSQIKSDNQIEAIGNIMHALQDASVPHHSAGCLGNFHGLYETRLDQALPAILNDQTFCNGVIDDFKLIEQTHHTIPKRLTLEHINMIPSSTWPIDGLVTFLAIQSYWVYKNIIYKKLSVIQEHEKPDFDTECFKKMTRLTLAVCMHVLNRIHNDI